MIANFVAILISFIQLVFVFKYIKPNNVYNGTLHYFLVFPIILMQLIPSILSLLLLENQSFSMQLGQIYAYSVNLTYFILFLSLYLVIIKNNFFSSDIPDSIIKIFLIISPIINILSMFTYLNLASINLEVILFPFFNFILNISKIFPFIAFIWLTRNNTFNRKLAIFAILIYFISIIPTGHRTSLIMPVFFLLFYNPRITFRNKLILPILLTLLFVPISDAYKSLRIIANPIAIEGNYEHISTTFAEEVNERLKVNNEVSAGIAKMIIEEGSVGLKPLISSAYTIIPSSFYPDNVKPWPGSIDGSSDGILVRVAHEYLYQSGYNMSEYMTPLHPLWELGIIYFFINIILTTVWLIALLFVSRLVGDNIGLLAIASFMPFTYSMPIQPIVYIFQSMPYITIPGIIFFIMLRFFLVVGSTRIR